MEVIIIIMSTVVFRVWGDGKWHIGLIDEDKLSLLDGHIYYNQKERLSVRVNKGREFATARSFDLGQVVISIDYMWSHCIPVNSLNDVLHWINSGEYKRCIGEAHHRLPKADNRICALQAVGNEKHKRFRGTAIILLDIADLETYIRQTEIHCFDCDASSCTTKKREESFPNKCEKCRHRGW